MATLGDLLGDLLSDGNAAAAPGSWAASGAAELTGRADGPPLPPPGDPAGAAAYLIGAWRTASGVKDDDLGVSVLAERAVVAGFGRGGDVSCGGATRLLPAADGWVALSLARRDDLESVPALVQEPVDDPWTAVAGWLGEHAAGPAVERARLLGLAAAVVPDHRLAHTRPGVVAHAGGPRQPRTPRVLDLTSLWAGPLAGHLLQVGGADVVKVESILRPDGARRGTLGFFHLLHAGKRCLVLDFEQDADLLRRLIRAADVVLESSRPRALAQYGIDAAAEVDRGAIWASITAHGRDVDAGSRVGFGDDVAAGAGLVARDDDGPVFCGDAIADPLAGLAAAAAVARALDSPTGVLLDVSMHDVARVAAGLPSPAPGDGAGPRFRKARGFAPALGAHTAEVVREWLG